VKAVKCACDCGQWVPPNTGPGRQRIYVNRKHQHRAGTRRKREREREDNQ
jgi:hypothetical protein